MSFQTSCCRGNFAWDRNLSSPDAHRCFVGRADSISCCFSKMAWEPRGTSCSKTWHHWRQMWLLTPTSAESAFHSVSLGALSIFLFELLWLISPWCRVGGWQNFSITLLCSYRGEGKYNKGSWVKDRQRPLKKYHHGQNRLKLEILTEFTTNKIRAG